MHTRLLLLAFTAWTGIRNAPAVESDLSALAAANNKFAFKLTRLLAGQQRDANVFVSPYSAAVALQMTANGAAGLTRTEIQRVLETSGLSMTAINESSRTAAALLNPKDTNVILTTANALWYRQGIRLKPGFIQENQRSFSSTIQALDFSDAVTSENIINQWASGQTHGRITHIADGMIDPITTDLLLANAIYFKGRWRDPFDVKLTKDRPFHSAGGAATTLPMMEMSRMFPYRKGTGYQAVCLPYMGDDLAMYVFLPDPGSSPARLLEIMNGDNWRRVTLPGFKEQKGRVVLPKFKLENTLDLKSVLKLMGMKTAFDSDHADFSSLFEDRHFISMVRQKALVEVSEEGTEAAAVTAIGVSPSAIFVEPETPFELVVDRPFLFAIVDARSTLILFMGVVNTL